MDKPDRPRTHVRTQPERVSSTPIRRRLLESEKRERQKLEALHASAIRLSKAQDLDSVWQIVIESLTGVLGFGVVSIGVVDRGFIRFTKASGVTLPEGHRVHLDRRGINAKAIRTLKTQLIDDITTNPEYFLVKFKDDGAPAIKSELVVPVFQKGKAEAVINVYSPKRSAFDEDDIKFIETLGMQASSAISRVRHTETLQRLVEEKTAELRDADQLAAAGRISAMVAHDLRSPIQVIRNATAIIKMKPNLTDKMLNTIEESCARAEKMLESFRSDTRDTPLNIEAVDFGSLLRAVLEESPPPTTIKVKLKIDKDLENVRFDKFRVRRILENLTDNAIEAMQGKGTLSVSAKMKGRNFIVSVSDTGVGISETDLPKLFKAFHTTKPKGLGLGLVFCKRAVEAQGGRITVKSKLGKCTTFTFNIPQRSKT